MVMALGLKKDGGAFTEGIDVTSCFDIFDEIIDELLPGGNVGVIFVDSGTFDVIDKLGLYVFSGTNIVGGLETSCGIFGGVKKFIGADKGGAIG